MQMSMGQWVVMPITYSWNGREQIGGCYFFQSMQQTIQVVMGDNAGGLSGERGWF